MPVKVAIFEDDPKFLEALSILVTGLPDLELVGAWLNTRDLIDHLKDSLPHVVLMDIGIKPIDGIEASKLILENYPDTKVLVQTIFEDDDKVFAAICAGASGYILKGYLPAALPGSIMELTTGGTPISPIIARKILRLFKDHFDRTGLADTYNLTKREKEILKCLVEGGTYKSIAHQCGIAFDTVKTHLKNIYEKLHVASMSGAVAKAIQENLT